MFTKSYQVSKKNGQQLTVTVTEDEGILMMHAKTVCDRVCLVKRNDLSHAMLEHAAITSIKVIEKYGDNSEDYCTMARVIKEEFN